MNARNVSQTEAAPSTVAIIGSGFGGLCMAIQLKKAGIDAFVILEKAGSVGGTWRDNTYPGAACDVQSHLYSYSFEPKHDWTRKFGLQAEIRQYMEDCVRKYGLAPHLRFNTEVVSADFDRATGQWHITTADGETLRAQTLVTACGQLNRPATPKLKGIENFRGKVFHSARWDHDYDLGGKSVAVIGTGASAIQFVPEIVPRVKSLSLFQRSGAWVVPKADRPFRRFEQILFDKLPALDRSYRTLIYWKNESRAIAFTRFGSLLELWALQSRWIARQVRNPVKRKKLIPDYKIGCKRLLLSNDWFPALNQDHVDVVTEPIDHVETDAVVTADGTRHLVDTIIYGTGFQATDFLAPMQVRGLDGRDLNEAWRDGAEAYKGICVSGFPNLFMLYGPNTNLAHSSIVFMLEAQVNYALKGIRTLRDRKLKFIDVKPARQDAYSAHIQQRLTGSVWDSGCTSWYKTAAGKNTNNWPGFTFSFRLMTRKLDLDDYELHPAT